MDRKTVLCIGAFAVPAGDPAAARVLANAKAIRAAGIPVVIAGVGESPRPQDREGDGKQRFQGLEYEVIAEADDVCSRRTRLQRFLAPGSALSCWLRVRLDRGDVLAVISAGGYAHYLLRLLRICRTGGVPLICDVMEWFAPRHCTGGPFGLQRWNVELTMRRLVPAAGNVIAISSFLERHYRDRGCRVLRIPMLVDPAEPRWQPAGPEAPGPENGSLRLLFSGNWKRDRQDLILRGMSVLRERGRPVGLEYLGTTATALARYDRTTAALLSSLGHSVKFHGRVPAEQVLRITASADFGLLLRDRARWSEACFPSRSVEFQAVGVPLLCNLSSDLGEHLREGENALIVRDLTVQAFVDTVERALALPQTRRQEMRQAARRCAETRFDYRNFVHPLGDFVRQAARLA